MQSLFAKKILILIKKLKVKELLIIILNYVCIKELYKLKI